MIFKNHNYNCCFTKIKRVLTCVCGKCLEAIFDYLELILNRYGVDINKGFKDPNKWLFLTAEKHTSGDRRRMANKLLEDFRNQFLGNICLEIPL